MLFFIHNSKILSILIIIPEHKPSTSFLPVDLAHDLIFSRGLYIHADAPVGGHFFIEHMSHRKAFSHAGTYPVAETDDLEFETQRRKASNSLLCALASWRPCVDKKIV